MLYHWSTICEKRKKAGYTWPLRVGELITVCIYPVYHTRVVERDLDIPDMDIPGNAQYGFRVKALRKQ